MIFENRKQAGQLLAQKLENLKGEKNLLVLAIPRGGVIVGREIASFLNCSLDIIITKKIPAPENSELAIGAVGAVGEPVIDEELAQKVGADEEYLKFKILNLKLEIGEKEKKFRRGKKPLDLKDKVVILTDDGVATGATMRMAVEIVRQQEPKKIIVAVPVIAKDSLEKISSVADEVIYLEAPELFFAVGQFYKEFEQIKDEEVLKILNFK
ncbi:MAG: phosphoribosyltransferase [Microgenomates group bacterium]